MPKYSAKYIAPGNSAPAGWVKYGNIAIDIDGIANASAQPFTPGIDESLDATRYVIITDSTNAGLAGRKIAGGPATASADIPTFWVSSAKTDDSFCQLVNRLPGRQGLISLTSSIDAFNWLISNGYWSSFTQSVIVTNGLTLNLDASKTESYPGSGNTWYDISGNSLNANLVNGPAFNSSNGGSIVFDGSNDYGEISNDSRLNASTQTISVWYRATNLPTNWANLVGKHDFNASQFGYLLTDRNNFYVKGTNAQQYNVGNGNGIINTWYFVTATININSLLKFYLNGSFINSSGVGNFTITNQPLRIGRSVDLYWNLFKGNIGQIMIHNRVLTDAEVLQNYNATRSRFGL